MGKDPLRFLKDIFAEVEKETKRKTGKKFYTWAQQYDNWISIIAPVIKDIPRDEQINSMIVFRLMELQKVLLWLQICASYGAYCQLVRELRYLLESTLQAYYLDCNYPAAVMPEKLMILREQEMELYGTKMIDKLDLKCRGEFKSIYRWLSKYTHGSYKQLKTVVERGKFNVIVTFGFDDGLFNECEKLTNVVLDAIFYVTLSRFPTIALKLRDDEMFVYWLRELKSELCLKLLEDLKKRS